MLDSIREFILFQKTVAISYAALVRSRCHTTTYVQMCIHSLYARAELSFDVITSWLPNQRYSQKVYHCCSTTNFVKSMICGATMLYVKTR